MSFVIAFRPFCQVACSDDAGDPVHAFRFRPTADGARKLADHRMLFRPRPDGFALYYQGNPEVADPLLAPIAARTRFGFTMSLAEPDFFARHHPDFTQATGPQLYLDNLSGAGAIQSGGPLTEAAEVEVEDAARLGARKFAARVDLTPPAPVSLDVTDKFSGAAVTSAAVNAAAGATATVVEIDLVGEPSPVFGLTETPPGTETTTIYTDDAVAAAAPLGVLDIYWDQRQDAVPAAGLDYSVVFRRRT